MHLSLRPARAFAAPLAFLSIHLAAHALTADHYELALRPDYTARVLEGHARIRLKADGEPAQAIDIASPNLQIARATVDGRAAPVEKTATGWRVAPGAAPAHTAPSWLEIDYRAPAADGLVFGAEYVYTGFHTCQWMPCIGSDLTRATVAIGLDLPAGQRSVASGGPRAYPLYTLGFAAGRFSEAMDPKDARLRYLGVADDAAALRAKFAGSARVLAFLEDKAGVPLPAAVYTQLLVPGSAAQEVSSFSVIGKRMLDPILEDPEDDWVVVHEMAHQWWGNLVTCASWSEFWLNEGIVVFMTAAWNQQRWGEAGYRREIDAARERWQRAKDAGFDKPLSWPGAYPNLRTRRDIQYGKGAVFMHVLREEIGERAFWDGLARYTRDNAGRGVRSADLQAAMERSAGRALQPLFDRWVY
jgi:aminopeptidase N